MKRIYKSFEYSYPQVEDWTALSVMKDLPCVTVTFSCSNPATVKCRLVRGRAKARVCPIGFDCPMPEWEFDWHVIAESLNSDRKLVVR